MENSDEITRKEVQQKALAASIMLSLDMENNFKLYSYRIIATEEFLERVEHLLEEFKESLS